MSGRNKTDWTFEVVEVSCEETEEKQMKRMDELLESIAELPVNWRLKEIEKRNVHQK